MEFQNFIIFKDWFTLRFKDHQIQEKYNKNKYSFWKVMFTLTSFFIAFTVLLSLDLWMMYNDKTKDVDNSDLIFNAVMAVSCLIFMLFHAFWKTKYFYFNVICSFFQNFTHYIVFESIKIVSFTHNQDTVGVFVITIIEFCTKGIWLFFVDDNFIFNLCCYIVFLPIYITVFSTMYEKQDNELGFFIIIFSFLVIGIYFIERIFKISYFGNETYDQEIIRNKNLIDNMKSGFVMFNLDDGKITYNKIMKNKYIPKLLTGVKLPNANLDILNKEDEEEDNIGNKKKDDRAESSNTMINKENDEDFSANNVKQCNIIKNILFTRLERVNAHDFEGELKKASDEINQKIQAFTTKSNKYIFFNTTKTKGGMGNIKKITAKDKLEAEDEKSRLDKSEFNRSEMPLIKDSNFNLLSNNDFENLISILLNNTTTLREFKYLGTKRIKQEHDDEFICQIFVRYYDHGRNLEFVLCESNSRRVQITANTLAKGLITNNNLLNNYGSVPTYNNNNNFNNNKINFHNVKNSKASSLFINKANSTIKHPLLEISTKMKEAIELLENPVENIEEIREILYYTDNLSGLALYSLEDLKYMNKPGKKKITLEKAKIDLPNLIENVIDLAKAKLKFKHKDIRIVYELGQNVDDFIISDGKKLSHVLLNLLQNSINATSYGNIQIMVETKSKRRDMLLFTVYDQGIQMKKQTIDYYNKTLIEDFDKVTGLVICKQLVDCLGRELKLENIGSQGTKASFYVKSFDEENLNEDPQLTTDLSDEDDDKVDIDIDIGGCKENNYNDHLISSEPNLKNVSVNKISNIETLNKIELQNSINKNINSIKRFSVAYGLEVVDTCDLRIIFADNDPELRAVFRKHIETFAVSQNLNIDMIECKDGADLIYSVYTHFEANKCVDAVLFDENMNFITGAVLVEIISILFKRTVIPENLGVFMTTEFEMNPSQYKFLKHIAKPIDYNTIKKYFNALIQTPK